MSEEVTLDDFATKASPDGGGNTLRLGPKQVDIPDSWSVSTFEEVNNPDKPIGYGVVKPGEDIDDGTPLVKIEDVVDGYLSSDQIFHQITDEKDEKYSRSRLSGGEILVSIQGTVGDAVIVPPEMEGANISRTIARVTPEQPNNFWIKYYIESKPVQDYIQVVSSGSTRASYNIGDIRKTNVALPPLSEQRKIATVLYTVDWAIEKTEEIIKKYQSIISGLIQDIATTGIGNKNLNEQKVPMLPEKWEIPAHWKLEFLENITTLITDGAHQTPTYVDNGVPFLKVENIKQDKIDWNSVARIPEEEHNDLIKSGNPTNGDVLLSKNGTIGISKVVDWNREFSHFVSLALIRPNQDVILPDYLATLLESQICMRQAKARSKTGTVTNLHLEEIEKLSIPVPPISEQKDILEKISTVKDCLNSEVRYRDRLQRLKQGLMQDLLSGTVRTTDTNIEVPEEIARYG